ncbi:MAG TPA: ABC transporter permease subunit [Kofleriaceae bacterium]|nr:ABC transporter permease subunit [Kofleriaceae bacterium]
MIASYPVKNAFLPNRPIDRKIAVGLVAGWLGVALLLWIASPFASLPGPGEVWRALGEMWWEGGMGPELFTTLHLIFHALALTLVISLVLSYATVVPFMRPAVEAVSKLRFLGITGLVVPFTLWTGGGYDLKVYLLTFSMTTYFVTAMAQVVVEIPRENFDYMRALGASELRTLWEVVIRGTLDKAFDVTRQNLAIGWTMITMVEGISRAEGGLGALILNQNKHFRLAEVYAILLVILVVGLLLDYAIGVVTRIVCPYSVLDRMAR